MSMTESFPRQQARTRRFSLGAPRAFSISPDGTRIVFLRSRGGSDPGTCLWQAGVASGAERLVADPAALNATDEDLPPEERARRERAREQAGGVVSYAADRELRTVVFSLSGRVFTADLLASAGTATATPRELDVQTPALDPRPDPSGARLAYVSGGALRVGKLGEADGADGADEALVAPGEN